ncbi:DNA adenine methylase [Lysinibacillus sp. UGB7]|uniref:DNA adenine methylase n=1 Tax=Lysinibacillus sp. UGB7 TaxID=3411039 RepID=UPI003B76B8BA
MKASHCNECKKNYSYECRNCFHDDHDDINDQGWWCCDCDTFNFWDESEYEKHQFIIVLEDKSKMDQKVSVPTKFKKQLSPLRYPGAKSKLISYLSTLLNYTKCKTIISPFVGGGSFELALLESGITQKLILNDLDYGIYSLWWCMLNSPDALIDRIYSFSPTHKAFFEARRLIKNDYLNLNMIDAAWITLMVNRLAFSGIAKANPLGGKNGSKDNLISRWNPLTLEKRINKIHSMAENIEIHCEQATTFIENWFWDDNATLFIDPPYFSKGKFLYNQYFKEEQHISLALLLRALHYGYPSADIIVTYDYNKFIDNIYYATDKREIIGRKYSI